MKLTNNSLNIIYLCHVEKGPSGGAKVVYDHSEQINKLHINNLTSEILHVGKKKISKWNTSIKKIFNLSRENYFGWSVKDINARNNFKSKWLNNNINLKENFIFNKE